MDVEHSEFGLFAFSAQITSVTVTRNPCAVRSDQLTSSFHLADLDKSLYV